MPEAVVEKFSDITKVAYRLGYEINKTCKAIGIEETLNLIPGIESGSLSRTDVQAMQANIITTLPDALAHQPDPDEPLVSLEPPPLPPVSVSVVADANGLPEAHKPPHTIIQTESPVKNVFMSSSGHKLFAYNNASRGMLIRIDPGISMKMNNDFIQDLGRLIEAYCGKAV